MPLLSQLPPPPVGKVGFPFTESSNTPPQYFLGNLPKITIVTPSFNQGQYIEETIRSVLLQGYPNLEYIIIDGGSTDNSVGIIKKYEEWLTYWVSEPDEGQSDAINKGLKLATGEVFNWLNSDDAYKPEALLRIGQAFANDWAINVLCGKEEVLATDGSRHLSNGTTILPTLEATIARCHNNQPPTFFRLSALDIIGRNVSTKLHYMMDAELWVRYLLHFGLSGIQKTEAVFNQFRLHDASKSVAQANRFQTDRFNILLNLLENMPQKSQNTEGVLRHLQQTQLPRYFQKNYTWTTSIDYSQLTYALIDQYFTWLIQYLNWGDFLKLYIFIVVKIPALRHRRMVLSPFIKIKRLLFCT